MKRILKYLLLIQCLFLGPMARLHAQLTIMGTVYDSTKLIPVKDVRVLSTSGTRAITDSNGHYEIACHEKDSLTFFYSDKATAKFAVYQVQNPGSFDISLHIRVKSPYKLLKEVRVFTRSYRQDSLENRERFSSIFNHSSGGISPSVNPTTGVAGLDLNELINLFRFRRNRQMQKMQERLMEQEQENYINYRFSKATVRRITRLEGDDLEQFMRDYRPDFNFTSQSSTVDFYQYILNASYHFRAQKLKGNYAPSSRRPG